MDPPHRVLGGEPPLAPAPPDHPRSFGRVSVFFTCAEDIEKFAALVGQPVTQTTTSIWFPYREQTDLSSQQWAEVPGDAPHEAVAMPAKADG